MKDHISRCNTCLFELSLLRAKLGTTDLPRFYIICSMCRKMEDLLKRLLFG